jgi:hypothetical protein
MTVRRSGRTAHVRPRPPSSGRPGPAKVRPRAPAPGRVSVHGPVRRSRGIPLVGRLALGVAVLALAGGILYVAVGGVGIVAGSLGATVTSFVEGVTATPTPAITPAPVSNAPTIESPTEPYTNVDSADLAVTVDQAIVGDPEYRLRVYLALKDQAPAPIGESPVGPIPQNVIPVTLTKGINDFSVTLVGPGGESEQSPVVRYVLDQSKPPIKLESPKDGATVNRKAVDLEGKTQGRSTLIARNRDTGDSIGGTAAADGAFALKLPLGKGTNRITIASTDPAGNTRELDLVVRRGSGELSASVSSSDYRIRRKDLPRQIRLIATVDDPDGKPLKGARVTFTLSIPGVKTVTSDDETDSNGRAVFVTTIPKSADRGGGSAAILVRTDEFGRTTDQTVITIRR